MPLLGGSNWELVSVGVVLALALSLKSRNARVVIVTLMSIFYHSQSHALRSVTCKLRWKCDSPNSQYHVSIT